MWILHFYANKLLPENRCKYMFIIRIKYTVNY